MTAPPESEMLAEPAVAPETTPPHELANPTVGAITIPVGNVSLKANPVAPVSFVPWMMLKVRILVPPAPMVDGLKTLPRPGGPTTARVAVLLVAPVPPSVEVSVLVVLLTLIAVVPFTLRLMVHDPPANSVPPDRFNDVEADVAPPTVPLQVFVNAGVAATCRPLVRVSVKATPLSEFKALGFVMVKVNVVFPFNGIVDAPNALLIVAGARTVSVAVLLTAPVPVCVEEIVPVVFGLAPTVVPVTFTLSVQVLPGAALVPPVSETLPPLAAGVPPQVFVRFGVAATAKPAGKASLKATPVRAVVLPAGLAIVKVSVVVPLSGTVGAPKALLIVGSANAVRVAVLLAVPVPPLVEVTAPVVLGKLPGAVAVTFTLTAQLALTATAPPVSETLPEPAVAVGVPAQVFVRPGVAAITRPVGNVSLKATPVRAAALDTGFVIVKVSVVVPFTPIEGAPKALLIVGGATEFRVAVLLAVPVPPLVELTAPVVLDKLPA